MDIHFLACVGAGRASGICCARVTSLASLPCVIRLGAVTANPLRAAFCVSFDFCRFFALISFDRRLFHSLAPPPRSRRPLCFCFPMFPCFSIFVENLDSFNHLYNSHFFCLVKFLHRHAGTHCGLRGNQLLFELEGVCLKTE